MLTTSKPCDVVGKMLSDCKASERELTIDLLSEKMVSAIHVYITESRYRHLFVKMFKILNIFVADESFRSKFELNNNIVLILIKILALVDTEEIYQDNDTFQLILSNLVFIINLSEVSREFIQKISRIVFLKNQNVNKGYTPLEMDNISEYVGDFDHFEDNSFVPIHILYNTFKNLKASNSHFTKTIKCTEVQLQDNGSNEYFFDFLNDNDTNKSVDSKFILIAKLIQLMDVLKCIANQLGSKLRKFSIRLVRKYYIYIR
ncbi:hypothetical protein HZS_3966 [Henneguya salminicola]|nr:hypothetical protein HZS_3966 [Henneguya salminicola]